MKLDILAIAAHPDDVEISAGGTVLKSIQQGKKVGIVDLTRGELGSRGSGDLRMIEAEAASKILGISVRVNLGLADGFFENNEASLRKIIEQIRIYKPEIVLTNAPSDRHPDHGRASQLVREACFYSGLRKIETGQEAWRPKSVYMFNQDYYNKPDFVVDVTEFWETKMEALKAYGSQFFDPNSKEPKTPISGEEFFDFLRARSMDFGRPAGYLLAEGFMVDRTIGVEDLFHLK
ncbi:MAG: bacillithiol biosynthesis deacetylase BshB1 [Flavobacteriales bacterium]|jgi:bacillithiol biosynthesis deacetylase BshB1